MDTGAPGTAWMMMAAVVLIWIDYGLCALGARLFGLPTAAMSLAQAVIGFPPFAVCVVATILNAGQETTDAGIALDGLILLLAVLPMLGAVLHALTLWLAADAGDAPAYPQQAAARRLRRG